MTAVRDARVRTRFPGATGAFALFGEVLWTGILVALCSLPIVTAPAALAAGIRHLRRYLHARDSRAGLFFRDVRVALARGGLASGVVIGVVASVVVGLLLLQATVIPTLDIPAAGAVTAVALTLVVVLCLLLCLASASWGPTRGWRLALGMAVPRAIADPVGTLLVAVAVGLTAIAAWQLPPLLVPALGCLAFAVTVVTGRRRP